MAKTNGANGQICPKCFHHSGYPIGRGSWFWKYECQYSRSRRKCGHIFYGPHPSTRHPGAKTCDAKIGWGGE